MMRFDSSGNAPFFQHLTLLSIMRSPRYPALKRARRSNMRPTFFPAWTYGCKFDGASLHVSYYNGYRNCALRELHPLGTPVLGSRRNTTPMSLFSTAQSPRVAHLGEDWGEYTE